MRSHRVVLFSFLTFLQRGIHGLFGVFFFLLFYFALTLTNGEFFLFLRHSCWVVLFLVCIFADGFAHVLVRVVLRVS